MAVHLYVGIAYISNAYYIRIYFLFYNNLRPGTPGEL